MLFSLSAAIPARKGSEEPNHRCSPALRAANPHGQWVPASSPTDRALQASTEDPDNRTHTKWAIYFSRFTDTNQIELDIVLRRAMLKCDDFLLQRICNTARLVCSFAHRV